ncbi:MAG: glyoxalase superfamily protein [Motiliproteus sp.]
MNTLKNAGITDAKTYADNLQHVFEHTGHPLKRSRSLELIASWYGYKSFSDLRTNTTDRTIPRAWPDLVEQAVCLIKLHPELGFSLPDLTFKDGAPLVIYHRVRRPLG